MVLKAGPAVGDDGDDESWREDWRRNPFLAPPAGYFEAVYERFEEEWETFKWMCPYCGAKDVACHRLDEHPEMWIGGSNAYGTDFHGWADH